MVLGKPDKVVVNCLLTTDENQCLTLVYAKTLNNGLYYEPVNEAVVELFKNDVPVGVFTKTGSRTWSIAHRSIPGAVYNLVVTIPNRQLIVATTTMPAEPVVSFIRETTYKKFFEQDNQLSPQWMFALNSDFGPRWEDPLVEPLINASDKLIENIATNHTFADRFNQFGNLNDIIGSEASLPAYSFYIRVNPATVKETFELEAGFSPQCFVVFRNASIEYDAYLKSSFQKMRIYADENDPAAWFDENEVYSNIKNGIGIFGAYYDKIFVFGNVKLPEK